MSAPTDNSLVIETRLDTSGALIDLEELEKKAKSKLSKLSDPGIKIKIDDSDIEKVFESLRTSLNSIFTIPDNIKTSFKKNLEDLTNVDIKINLDDNAVQHTVDNVKRIISQISNEITSATDLASKNLFNLDTSIDELRKKILLVQDPIDEEKFINNNILNGLNDKSPINKFADTIVDNYTKTLRKFEKDFQKSMDKLGNTILLSGVPKEDIKNVLNSVKEEVNNITKEIKSGAKDFSKIISDIGILELLDDVEKKIADIEININSFLLHLKESTDSNNEAFLRMGENASALLNTLQEAASGFVLDPSFEGKLLSIKDEFTAILEQFKNIEVSFKVDRSQIDAILKETFAKIGFSGKISASQMKFDNDPKKTKKTLKLLDEQVISFNSSAEEFTSSLETLEESQLESAEALRLALSKRRKQLTSQLVEFGKPVDLMDIPSRDLFKKITSRFKLEKKTKRASEIESLLKGGDIYHKDYEKYFNDLVKLQKDITGFGGEYTIPIELYESKDVKKFRELSEIFSNQKLSIKERLEAANAVGQLKLPKNMKSIDPMDLLGAFRAEYKQHFASQDEDKKDETIFAAFSSLLKRVQKLSEPVQPEGEEASYQDLHNVEQMINIREEAKGYQTYYGKKKTVTFISDIENKIYNRKKELVNFYNNKASEELKNIQGLSNILTQPNADESVLSSTLQNLVESIRSFDKIKDKLSLPVLQSIGNPELKDMIRDVAKAKQNLKIGESKLSNKKLISEYEKINSDIDYVIKSSEGDDIVKNIKSLTEMFNRRRSLRREIIRKVKDFDGGDNDKEIENSYIDFRKRVVDVVNEEKGKIIEAVKNKYIEKHGEEIKKLKRGRGLLKLRTEQDNQKLLEKKMEFEQILTSEGKKRAAELGLTSLLSGKDITGASKKVFAKEAGSKIIRSGMMGLLSLLNPEIAAAVYLFKQLFDVFYGSVKYVVDKVAKNIISAMEFQRLDITQGKLLKSSAEIYGGKYLAGASGIEGLSAEAILTKAREIEKARFTGEKVGFEQLMNLQQLGMNVPKGGYASTFDFVYELLNGIKKLSDSGIDPRAIQAKMEAAGFGDLTALVGIVNNQERMEILLTQMKNARRLEDIMDDRKQSWYEVEKRLTEWGFLIDKLSELIKRVFMKITDLVLNNSVVKSLYNTLNTAMDMSLGLTPQYNWKIPNQFNSLSNSTDKVGRFQLDNTVLERIKNNAHTGKASVTQINPIYINEQHNTASINGADPNSTQDQIMQFFHDSGNQSMLNPIDSVLTQSLMSGGK